MNINIFAHEAYKEFIRDYIKQHQRRGLISDLAEAAGCNRTYFSQVLGSKVQLTPDHIMGLAEYLRLNDLEENYFLLMLLKDRASTPKIKNTFKTKMDQLRIDNHSLTKKIKSSGAGELSEEQKAQYYSSWLFAAAHILTSASQFQSVEDIASRLRISKKLAQGILQDLTDMNLVKVTSGRYSHSGTNIHVSKGSAFNVLNHMHWRNKALEFSNAEDSLHFTYVFGLSKKEWPKLKEMLLKFIEEQRQVVARSGSDDVYCFTCDLFSP